MKKNTKRTKGKVAWLIGFSLLLLLVLFPLPYYIEGPGSAEDTAQFVQVNGKEDSRSGSFMLTTVALQKASPVQYIFAQFAPFYEPIHQKDLMGDSTGKEYQAISAYQMTSSENIAKKVASDLAHKPYKLAYRGVYIMGITPESNFKNSLKMGDTVYKVDQLTFKNATEFMDYIKKQKVGQKVTIHYKREGKKKQASGRLIRLKQDKKAGLGITLVDHSEFTADVPITIDAGKIGGPSAGLMFTLETYSLLSGEDLRKGRQIAGTGTINEKGEVGSIGGIDKKVVAANQAGASLFFAPAEEIPKEIKEKEPTLKSNYEVAKQAAKQIKTTMKIVPVKNVQEAIDYLRETGQSN